MIFSGKEMYYQCYIKKNAMASKILFPVAIAVMKGYFRSSYFFSFFASASALLFALSAFILFI